MALATPVKKTYLRIFRYESSNLICYECGRM